MWVNTEKVKNKIKYYLVAINKSESSDQSTKDKKNSTAQRNADDWSFVAFFSLLFKGKMKIRCYKAKILPRRRKKLKKLLNQ